MQWKNVSKLNASRILGLCKYCKVIVVIKFLRIWISARGILLLWSDNLFLRPNVLCFVFDADPQYLLSVAACLFSSIFCRLHSDLPLLWASVILHQWMVSMLWNVWVFYDKTSYLSEWVHVCYEYNIFNTIECTHGTRRLWKWYCNKKNVMVTLT